MEFEEAKGGRMRHERLIVWLSGLPLLATRARSLTMEFEEAMTVRAAAQGDKDAQALLRRMDRRRDEQLAIERATAAARRHWPSLRSPWSGDVHPPGTTFGPVPHVEGSKEQRVESPISPEPGELNPGSPD